MSIENKVKILYVGPIPPEAGGKNAGGIATHCWELAVQAQKKGYEVYILADNASTCEKNGIKVITFPRINKLLKMLLAVKLWITADNSNLDILKFLSFKEKITVLYKACFLQDIIKSAKPTVIHIHSLYNDVAPCMKIIQLSVPLIVTNHEFYFRGENEKVKDIAIVNCILGITDYIICVSEYTKSLLEKSGLYYQGKLKIIYNPIESDKLPLLEKKDVKEKMDLGMKKVVLFIGGYKAVEKKGLDILLKAFRTCPYLLEKCKLIIKSNIEGINYAKTFMDHENNIDGLVLQDQPWAQMINYYNAADVFVMPSRSEGFGIVYSEALLAGTPVIGFHKTISEMEKLFDNYIGEKFDASSEDENALAEKIIKVLNTEFDRELLRGKTIEHLSWNKKFSEFAAVYREVLIK